MGRQGERGVPLSLVRGRQRGTTDHGWEAARVAREGSTWERDIFLTRVVVASDGFAWSSYCQLELG
jgi:hypothetical protein